MAPFAVKMSATLFYSAQFEPRSPVKSKLLTSLFALASGAIAVLAFSPFGYWPLVILSLLGLYALLDKASPRQAA